MKLNGESSRTARAIPLALLLAVLLLVGLAVGGDYGMSWDEDGNAEVGADALRSYVSFDAYLAYLEHGAPLAHHGPAHFMFFAAAAPWLSRLYSSGHAADGRHLATYLVYLAGVAGFYALAARLVPRRYAWMTTLLFATQPLLFGHAFINQKDTPFMACVILSVVIGMAAVDRLGKGPVKSGPPIGLTEWIRRDWTSAGRAWRLAAILSALFLLALAVDALLIQQSLRWLEQAVRAAYSGTAWEPIGRVFHAIAQDAYKTEISEYTAKARWAYGLLGRPAELLLAAGLFFFALVRCFPQSMRYIWGDDRTAIFLILAAGAMLGWTVAIRPIGALAGLLASVYGLHRLRARAGLPLLVYWAVAAGVAYLAWPYLWDHPLLRLWTSLAYTGNIRGSTLYRGDFVLSDALPWHYFPTLAAIELTEPIALLFVVGALVAAWRLKRREIDGPTLIVLALWLGIPLAGLLALGMGVSDNLRQLHFTLPPVFALAGIGLAYLLDRVRSRPVQLSLFLVVLIPGWLAISQLHPYEYTYFNSYVGGTARAHARFEQEYWCTSYREAMAQVNRTAETGDTVMALGIDRAARPFARPDLMVVVDRYLPVPDNVDFLLTCRHWLGYQDAAFERLYTVERSGTPFGEVLRRRLAPATAD